MVRSFLFVVAVALSVWLLSNAPWSEVRLAALAVLLGLVVYAVCARKPSDNALEKKEMRDQMYTETFDALAKTYLKELRSQAMIEYR